MLALAWLGVRLTGLAELALLEYMCLVLLVFAVSAVALPRRVAAKVRLQPARTSVGQTVLGVLEVANSRMLPRWGSVIDVPLPARTLTISIPPLWRQARHTVSFEIAADLRGVHEIGPVTSRASDPLGLLRRDVRWAEAQTLFVRPAMIALESLGAGQVVDLEGSASDQVSMSDLSFHALREYVRGDDLRHVHWRSSAKADQLLVRQYHDTRRSHAAVVVDADPAAYADPEDFELALSVAASIVVRVAQEDRDATFVCGSDVVRGRGSEEILDACCLAGLRPADLAAQCAQALQAAPETSAVVLATGGGRDVAEVRAALAAFGEDVRRITLRCDTTGSTEIFSGGHTSLADLRSLAHLPALLSQLGRARS